MSQIGDDSIFASGYVNVQYNIVCFVTISSLGDDILRVHFLFDTFYDTYIANDYIWIG